MLGQTNARIKGGGGNIGSGNYNVKVIDYDGTIIAEKNLNANETFTLPNAPIKTNGLVFKEWSSSVPIINNQVTVVDDDIMIGAIYDTVSGKNEFDIELTTATGLTVNLNMDGNKDWGDGTINTNTSHTYSSIGKYTIICDGTTMTTSSNSGLFNNSAYNRRDYVINARISNNTEVKFNSFINCTNLRTITMSQVSNLNDCFYCCKNLICCIIPTTNITVIGESCFAECCNLENVVIPYGIETIESSCFADCYTLKEIILPKTISDIDIYFLYNCYSLKKITIPQNVLSISSNSFRYVYAIKRIIIYGDITNIDAKAFSDCTGCLEYDFTNCTSIPTLANVDVFKDINQLCKIKVPTSLENSWKNETNWTTYADYIIGV